MKIDFLELKNYRQWIDQKINFSLDDEKNITIIQGSMGSGKTNILNAITWCLFGEEEHLSSKNKGLPMLNNVLKNQLEANEIGSLEIKIQLKSDENQKILIERNKKYKKTDNGDLVEIKEPIDDTFKVFLQKDGDINPFVSPNYLIEQTIPKGIKEYFFFDGEKINEYFNKKSGEKIKKAVFEISQIEILKNSIDHLKDVKGDVEKSIKNLSSDAEKFRAQKERAEEALKTFEKKLVDAKDYSQDAEDAIEKYGDLLKNTDVENIKKLQERNEIITSDLITLDDNLNNLNENWYDRLIVIAPKILIFNAIVNAKRLLQKTHESGDVPPDFKKEFLLKLLRNGKCICGNDISSENEYRKNIKNLVKGTDDITDISAEIITENINMSNLIHDIFLFKDEIVSYHKDYKDLNAKITLGKDELKEINTQIKNCNIEQIKAWHARLLEAKYKHNEAQETIGYCKGKLKDISESISYYDKQFQKELGKENKNIKFTEVIEFCQYCMDILSTIKDELMDSIRKEVEQKTREHFFSLIWKKETYKDVTIDENYNVSIISKDGSESLGTLSRGETQVLALSFIAALNNVSGFNVPIIIDTPLARISKDPKNNIASNLHDYLSDRQVILLVTDEEYTSEVRDRIIKSVGTEYKIIFEESTNGSKARLDDYEKYT